MLKVRRNFRKVIVIAICLAGFSANNVLGQSNKELAKMYDQLDSLENRKLELQRENDRVVLDCLKSDRWQQDGGVAYGCKNAVGVSESRISDNYWTKMREKSREICECMVGKKHEIEEIETKIKQLERRIELSKQDNNKPTPKVSPAVTK